MAFAGEFERVLHLFQLGLAAHELRESPLRGHLQAGPQRPQTAHLKDRHRFADALDHGRTQRLEGEISFAQPLRQLGRGDRTDVALAPASARRG